MSIPTCIVYVVQSAAGTRSLRHGVTSDVRARLDDHNAGRCLQTADGRPWRIDLFIQFADVARALKFDRYLKSGSGCAFAKRQRQFAR
jgi:predicted GIY-YIG superfamily endonuclease